jgi:DNA-binding IclR family transcriptional regulator
VNVSADPKPEAAVRVPEHRSVSRVMGILERVVAGEPSGLRLADLSDLLQAPKSTIHGLAKGLVANGYLREAGGRYYEGPALRLLLAGTSRIPPAYHRTLEQLSGRSAETAMIAMLVGDSVVNIAIVEPDQLIRASPVLNARRALWPTSYGKNFLANMDPRLRDGYLRRKHPDAKERTKILAELDEVRRVRVAFNRQENVPGLYGLSSPITANGGGVFLAIGLVGPASRMEPHERDLADDVRATAAGLSATSA